MGMKKKTQKKDPPKKKRKKKEGPSSNDEYASEFEEFKSGMRVSELATRLNIPRGKLRRMFTKLAGGKEAYRQIMDGFEPAVGTEGPREPPDDSGVRWIRSSEERKLWATEHYEPLRGKPFTILMDPKTGEIYKPARDDQKADLIIPLGMPGLEDWRLVHFQELDQQRKHREEREEAFAAAKEIKAEKRKIRKIRRKSK